MGFPNGWMESLRAFLLDFFFFFSLNFFFFFFVLLILIPRGGGSLVSVRDKKGYIYDIVLCIS